MEKGINPENIEFVINYEDVLKYDFKSLENTNRYKYILVGPMNHKQKGLTNNSSMIAELEANEKLNVRRITDLRGKLKISASSFANVL